MGCTTFFDVLSADDLSVVVRHLSESPRSEHWLSTIPRSARKLFFLGDTPFLRVVPLLVRSVRINCVKEGAGGVNSMNFFADDPLLVDVIEKHGAHIRHLRIVEHERTVRKLTETMYNRLITHCTGITQISFWFRGYSIKKQHHKRLLRSVQDDLSVLELKYEVPFSADMVAHFSGCEFPALDTLRIEGPQVDGILDKLLPRTKKTRMNSRLKTVDIQSWFSNWDVICRELGLKCERLECILLKGVLEKLHVPLLCSYGPQLVRANLQWLSYNGCEDVVAACPNVTSDLHIDWTYVHRLRLLAPHVSKLWLDPQEITSDEDYALLKQTSGHFSQLQSLSCVSNIADTCVLDALFYKNFKKPQLTHLRIGMRRAHFSTATLVHTTGTLRTADIMVGKFTDLHTLCNRFIANNRDLQVVKIGQAQKISSQKIAHNIALKILSSIRQHLKHITCIRLHIPALLTEAESIPPDTIAQFCTFFQLQGVDVRITPRIIFS